VVRGNLLYEIILDKYILGSRRLRKLLEGEMYNLLFAVADALYGEEISMIRSRRCPFCGKHFKRISQHLKVSSSRLLRVRAQDSNVFRTWWWDTYYTNPCVLKYSLMKKDIISTYLRLKALIKEKKVNSYSIKLQLPGMPLLRFRNRGELALYIRQNPDVIKIIR